MRCARMSTQRGTSAIMTSSSETLSSDGAKRRVSTKVALTAAATPADLSAAERVLVLEAGRAERNYWSDLWHYRDLFAILAWRDIAVRYKQTVIGVAWAVVRPFLTLVIFTIVFGRLAGLPSDGTAPYPVLVFAGMLPWFLFSSILGDASSSVVGNANLVSKVYFPRIIIPTASAVVTLVDFGINLVLLFGLMVWYDFAAQLAARVFARVRSSCHHSQSRAWPFDHRTQCEVPRLSFYHSVHFAVRSLRVAGRLL